MTEPHRSRVLGVFGKQPIPGKVKTRLAAVTSPEWAARVATAFLADTLERMSRIDEQTRCYLVHAPDEAEHELRTFTPERFALMPQGPGDLGKRLARFIASHVEQGPVVVIGSDSPTLSVEFVEEAFLCLSSRDVVIGPAMDGGYYLIGCRRFIPSLFSEIDWGSCHVLGQTIDRLQGLDVSLSLLQPWYDVDTLDDWRLLAGHIAALRRSGVDPGLPRTEALLREFRP